MAGGTPNRTIDAAASSGKLSMPALANLERWLTEPGLAAFVPEIEALAANERWDDLEDAFAARLSVGTGGIRGPLGPGPNRINARTIGEAAQGLSAFIDDYGAAAREAGVVVGHEARRQSREFAELSCEVFAAKRDPVAPVRRPARHAGDILRRTPPGGHRRGADHRVAQPAHRQRVQVLLVRRRAGGAAARRPVHAVSSQTSTRCGACRWPGRRRTGSYRR